MNTHLMEQKCKEGVQAYIDLVPTLMDTAALVKFEQLLKSELNKHVAAFMKEFPLLERFFVNPQALRSTDAEVLLERAPGKPEYCLRLSYALASHIAFVISVKFKEASSPMDTCGDVSYISCFIAKDGGVICNRIHRVLFDDKIKANEEQLRTMPISKAMCALINVYGLNPREFIQNIACMLDLWDIQHPNRKAQPFLRNPYSIGNMTAVFDYGQKETDLSLELQYNLSGGIYFVIRVNFNFNNAPRKMITSISTVVALLREEGKDNVSTKVVMLSKFVPRFTLKNSTIPAVNQLLDNAQQYIDEWNPEDIAKNLHPNISLQDWMVNIPDQSTNKSATAGEPQEAPKTETESSPMKEESETDRLNQLWKESSDKELGRVGYVAISQSKEELELAQMKRLWKTAIELVRVAEKKKPVVNSGLSVFISIPIGKAFHYNQE